MPASHRRALILSALVPPLLGVASFYLFRAAERQAHPAAAPAPLAAAPGPAIMADSLAATNEGGASVLFAFDNHGALWTCRLAADAACSWRAVPLRP